MQLQHSQGANLGQDKISRLLFQLALPAILAQLINLLYNMVDRMYIGHIPDVGPNALTGVGVTLPLIMCISAFAALVSMGGAPRASIMMGKGEPQQAERILGNCASMLVITALVLTVVIQCFGQDILMIFGASSNTISYAWDYMKIYSLGTLFVQLALGLNAFINAQGFARTGMLTVTIGAACQHYSGPYFHLRPGNGRAGRRPGHHSLPGDFLRLDSPLPHRENNHTAAAQLRYARLRGSVILPCIALGIAPFIMQFTESILNICFNTSLLRYGGDIAVGAMTILASVMQFCMLPLQGLTQGAQPIIGFNFGANQRDRVKEAFRLLLACCMVFAGLIWFLSMFVPQLFISIFTSDPQLADFTRWAIRIYMAVSLLHGIQISCQQTFIALGNAKTSVFLALLRKVILLIPLIYILPYFLADKVFAVFLAEPVADFIAVSTTATLFYRQYKKL